MTWDDLVKSIPTRHQSRLNLIKKNPVEGCAKLAIFLIGKRLHELGGVDLMRHVFDEVDQRAPDSEKPVILDHAWNSIGGDWWC